MVQPVVTFHRSISLGSYGGLNSELVEAFSRKDVFLEKNNPLRGNSQNFVPKGFSASWIHVLCANFMKFDRPEVGEIVRCLPDPKKISARSLALTSALIEPKICEDQRQTMYSECPKFHQNRFTSSQRSYSWTRKHRSNVPQSVCNTRRSYRFFAELLTVRQVLNNFNISFNWEKSQVNYLPT